MAKREKIIAGNWKMYKTTREAIAFVETLTARVKNTRRRILIAPPFTSIGPCSKIAAGSRVEIGAQNMSDKDEGAFTGEISGQMLKDVGATFVLLGHSERRQHFHETDLHIHHKLKEALEQRLTPILCIGENEKEREKGSTKGVLQKQLKGALGDLDSLQLHPLIVAYEPIWAIGTGKTATPQMAEETHKHIRNLFADQYGQPFADHLPILYGGSVKPNNIESLLNEPNIDGALIGGASLDVEAFSTMVLT